MHHFFESQRPHHRHQYLTHISWTSSGGTCDRNLAGAVKRLRRRSMARALFA